MENTSRYLPLRDRSASLRRQVTAKILRIFAGWGYSEIEVPLIDDFDIVKRGLSDEQLERTLRFLDRSGNVMMIRSDSTPAVAKALSFHLEKSVAPTRVSYANKVVRIEKSRTQWQLESYQIGVELIGIPGLAAEIELVCICSEIFSLLGINNFQFNITDHALVDRILTMTGAPARTRNEVKAAVIARDASHARSILSKVGVRNKFIDAVQTVADIEGGPEQLNKIKHLLGNDQELSLRIQRLERLFNSLNQLGFGPFVRIDLAELQRADYYDGFAFDVVSEGVGRSIGRGGRYDQLFGCFGRKTPAVGFVLASDLLCELIYPTVSVQSPHTRLANDGVIVSEDNLVEGFKRVLNRRRMQEQTHVIVKSRSSNGNS